MKIYKCCILIFPIFFLGCDSSSLILKDVNGDGYEDVLIGSQGVSANGKKTTKMNTKSVGEAYLYYGSKNGIKSCDLSTVDCIPDAIIKGGYLGGFMGRQLSIVGDINKDGYSDIVIGAHGAGDNNNGEVYIFYGYPGCRGEISSTKADVIISGVNNGDNFGKSVMSAGDINGDDFIDIIIGAPSAGNAQEGQAYVFLGGKNFKGKYGARDASTIITGTSKGDQLGNVVATAGDLNNDGFDDLAVTSRTADFGTDKDIGKVYIFLGSQKGVGSCDLSTGECVADTLIVGETAGDYFGNNISTAYDVNGDGYDDLIVGASRYGVGEDGLDGANVKGRAYIFLGAKKGIQDCNMASKNCANTIITGRNGDWLGTEVSFARDVNGDGYDDVLIGSDLAGEDYQGDTYLFFGSANGIQSCDTPDIDCINEYSIFRGKHRGDLVGNWMTSAAAGDINGDGFNDVLIGAPSLPGYAKQIEKRSGRVYLLLGPIKKNSSLDDAHAIFVGKYPWSWFGSVR